MKILFVTSRFPWPLDKGDKLRAYNQIRYLSKKHEIILFAISYEHAKAEWIKELTPYCKQIMIKQLSFPTIIGNLIRHAFSGLPFQTIFFYDRHIANALKQFNRIEKPDKIVLQLIRTTKYGDLFKTSHCVVDLMDCLSYHYFLRSKSSSFPGWLFYDREYRRIKKYETSLLSKYQDIIIISEKDKSLLPGNKFHVKVVGNGVSRDESEQKIDWDFQRTDLLFLGNLQYRPNIEAASFIINNIFPGMLAEDPGIHLTIAGIDARKKLSLPQRKNITIIENLTNTRPLFKSARVFIAPMFLSTGIQNKILEAMAYGLPVVTTPNAADAMGAINGVHLLTAISAEEFKAQIRILLQDEQLRNGIVQNATSFIERNCDWKKNTKLIETILTGKITVRQAAQL